MGRFLGMSARRQETQPPGEASALSDLVVKDLDGNDVRLGSLWEDGPAVLVWLRHYGWTFCRSHAVQLHRDRSKFEATGARLAVIGQGTPAQAAHFRESHKLEIPLYVDEGRDTYRAAGTKVGTFRELLGPDVVAKGMAASRRDKVVQGRTVGHPAQLGGVMIVKPGHEIAYVHLADDASDNPPNSEVLDAARAASRA